MGFFPSKTAGDSALILDIGSGNVGAALVHFARSAPPLIHYTTRREIPFQAETSPSRLQSAALRALSQTLLDISAEGFATAGFSGHQPHPAEAIVVLGAPWIASRTEILKFSSPRPIPINNSVFETLLKKSEAEQALSTGGMCIEKKLIHATLNGYPSSSFLDRPASRAEFSVCMSVAPKRLVTLIHAELDRLFTPRHTSMHSFALLGLAALRTLFPEQEDFLLCDVRGELTELFVIKRGVAAEHLSFPFGRNTLIRRLVQKTAAPPGGLSGLLALQSRRNSTGAFDARIKRELIHAREAWSGDFGRVISSFSQELFIPRTLVLISDEDSETFFSEAIHSFNWSAFSTTAEPAELKTLPLDVRADHLSWGLHARHDIFLGFETVGADRFRTS